MEMDIYKNGGILPADHGFDIPSSNETWQWQIPQLQVIFIEDWISDCRV